MANSSGSSRETGRPLTDWEHVQQSIADILTTPLGSRILRRTYGSELFELIDRKMTQRMVLAVYAASAVAINRWEPRFRVKRAAIIDASVKGRVVLALFGTYYPRGHLGDYTIAEDETMRVILEGGH